MLKTSLRTLLLLHDFTQKCSSVHQTCRAFTLRCYPVFERHGCAFSPLKTQKIYETLLQTPCIASAESTVTSVMPDFTCCYTFFNSQQKGKLNKAPVGSEYYTHGATEHLTARDGGCFLDLTLTDSLLLLIFSPLMDANCSVSLTCAWKTEPDVCRVQQVCITQTVRQDPSFITGQIKPAFFPLWAFLSGLHLETMRHLAEGRWASRTSSDPAQRPYYHRITQPQIPGRKNKIIQLRKTLH